MPDPKDIPVPVFMRSLLKTAYDQRGVAAIVIYSFIDGGEGKTMMTSNVPQARAAVMLAMLRGIPNLDAVAKALHEVRVGASTRCALCVEMGFIDDGTKAFADLSKGSQRAHRDIAQTLIDAAQAEAPRIIDPNAPPPA